MEKKNKTDGKFATFLGIMSIVAAVMIFIVSASASGGAAMLSQRIEILVVALFGVGILLIVDPGLEYE